MSEVERNTLREILFSDILWFLYGNIRFRMIISRETVRAARWFHVCVDPGKIGSMSGCPFLTQKRNTDAGVFDGMDFQPGSAAQAEVRKRR